MLITGLLLFFSGYVFGLTSDRHLQINFLIITVQPSNAYKANTIAHNPTYSWYANNLFSFLKNHTDSVRKAGTAKAHILHFI